MNGLACTVRMRRGDFELEAALRVESGEVLAVIGANGSGKSTLLGAIAGTHPIDSGVVRLGERTLCSREDSSTIVSLPRASRRVGFLDQRARLFPHLSARANIAFGPRARGVHRRAAENVADGWLARVGLPGRGDARPNELSGGQQQRVAIARTLAADPQLLLLDEPFAALDVTSSVELRELISAEVKRLQIPVILVTHDPLDLVKLADRVIVLEAGEIAQSGTVAEILGTPATPFAAAFTGRVLLKGVSSSEGFCPAAGPLQVLHGEGRLPAEGTAMAASFDPTAVEIAANPSALPTQASGRTNRWTGTIRAISAGSTGIRIECEEWPDFFAELPVARAFDSWITAGTYATWQLPPEAVRFTPSWTPRQPRCKPGD